VFQTLGGGWSKHRLSKLVEQHIGVMVCEMASHCYYHTHFGVGGISNTGADAVGVGVAVVVLSVALDVPPPQATNNATTPATKQCVFNRISIPLNSHKFILLPKWHAVE
jgi:hypothetical protein